MDKLIIIRTDNQNNLYEQIISLITANQAKMETMSFGVFPTLFFPGLEIRQHQRRVFRDGEEINLTRLEYSTLVFLASNPGNVLTQEQIFEAVWNMDSDSCHSSVVNVIYNLRKKIEPDSKNPTYIKTVLGIGYKFASGESQPNNRRPFWQSVNRKSEKGFLFFCARFCQILLRKHEKIFRGTLPYFSSSA